MTSSTHLEHSNPGLHSILCLILSTAVRHSARGCPNLANSLIQLAKTMAAFGDDGEVDFMAGWLHFSSSLVLRAPVFLRK